ncbi:MAG: HAMP domain-containing histidine kinase [Xanthomonadales bacterium]|nr:HAMP domain-containing histidine kinase [Xanthomonadales bacterium]
MLGVPVPVPPLLGGIALLAAFALFAFWRLRQPWPVTAIESVAHITVDTVVLGYLLYLSGGATNPFVSLLVMPITLAATALPLRPVAFVATLAVAAYLVLMRWHLPLPTMHAFGTPGGFRLHIVGMAISFAITATMLGFFIARLARALRAQQADAEHERVRALRDEGILAIATQAAGTAHELNTPLSTMSTLLAELARERADDPVLAADIELLRGQAARCRDILRELVKVGSNQLAGAPEATTIGAFAAAALDAFRLLRPEIEVRSTIAASLERHPIRVVPALRHALVNLLNNAADASQANGSAVVELALVEKRDAFELLIRDFGKGMPGGSHPAPGLRFETTKRDGLGLGLALAKATVERFGGSLAASAARDGGTEQHLRLPLPARENDRHEH